MDSNLTYQLTHKFGAWHKVTTMVKGIKGNMFITCVKKRDESTSSSAGRSPVASKLKSFKSKKQQKDEDNVVATWENHPTPFEDMTSFLR